MGMFRCAPEMGAFVFKRTSQVPGVKLGKVSKIGEVTEDDRK